MFWPGLVKKESDSIKIDNFQVFQVLMVPRQGLKGFAFLARPSQPNVINAIVAWEPFCSK